MENNDEFVDYIKRNPEAIKDNFRRKTTVQRHEVLVSAQEEKRR